MPSANRDQAQGALLQAKDKFYQARTDFEKETRDKRQELQNQERRLTRRKNLEKKVDTVTNASRYGPPGKEWSRAEGRPGEGKRIRAGLRSSARCSEDRGMTPERQAAAHDG